MNYFERSQAVRKEIEFIPELLDTARKAFAGQLQWFSSGGEVNLYRIGRTPSGLHVALRAFRPDSVYSGDGREREAEIFERYCQNAQEMDEKGEPVPAFCIGTICGQHAGVLTEDLTAGGQSEFVHDSDEAFGFVVDGNMRKKVFVDLDEHSFGGYAHRPNVELRYFLEGYVLVL